jgi:hypothetical protein
LDEFASEMDNNTFKRAPTVKLRHSMAPTGPKSAEIDEIDPIYKKTDPIGISIETRKKAGALTY